MTAAPAKRNLKRLAIFTGLTFVLSCAAWVLLIWLTEYGLRFHRTYGYALIIALCGIVAAAMKMWRKDQTILLNLSTAIICFVVPAVSLPLLGVTALYIACHSLTACYQ